MPVSLCLSLFFFPFFSSHGTVPSFDEHICLQKRADGAWIYIIAAYYSPAIKKKKEKKIIPLKPDVLNTSH